MEDNLLTVDDLAKRLNVNNMSIYRWVSQNRIPVIRVASLLRFDWDAVIEALSDNSDKQKEES